MRLQRWRVYYEAFLGDVDMSEQSTYTADRIIRLAANAADEALAPGRKALGYTAHPGGDPIA